MVLHLVSNDKIGNRLNIGNASFLFQYVNMEGCVSLLLSPLLLGFRDIFLKNFCYA